MGGREGTPTEVLLPDKKGRGKGFGGGSEGVDGEFARSTPFEWPPLRGVYWSGRLQLRNGCWEADTVAERRSGATTATYNWHAGLAAEAAARRREKRDLVRFRGLALFSCNINNRRRACCCLVLGSHRHGHSNWKRYLSRYGNQAVHGTVPSLSKFKVTWSNLMKHSLPNLAHLNEN